MIQTKANEALVPAETAARQIEETMRQMGLRGLRDLKVEIWTPGENAWTIGITFECSKYRFLWWGYGPMIQLGFQVTGKAHHNGDGGITVTSLEGDTGDKGPLYTIWKILYCEFFWVGESFADCLQRIKAFN